MNIPTRSSSRPPRQLPAFDIEGPSNNGIMPLQISLQNVNDPDMHRTPESLLEDFTHHTERLFSDSNLFQGDFLFLLGSVELSPDFVGNEYQTRGAKELVRLAGGSLLNAVLNAENLSTDIHITRTHDVYEIDGVPSSGQTAQVQQQLGCGVVRHASISSFYSPDRQRTSIYVSQREL